ncbi:hypothetical protein OBBRIDRAFT_21364 [Obba rivulosa]|uniref:Uncharacterized protein n=1 Tax=Obba rivulosa TaxID=1052685 RepID=A0A8E2J5G3_9APHY|nr:hypothetical protein OBBRIDRAFT_21364 [Obba rivulosa]
MLYSPGVATKQTRSDRRGHRTDISIRVCEIMVQSECHPLPCGRRFGDESSYVWANVHGFEIPSHPMQESRSHILMCSIPAADSPSATSYVALSHRQPASRKACPKLAGTNSSLACLHMPHPSNPVDDTSARSLYREHGRLCAVSRTFGSRCAPPQGWCTDRASGLGVCLMDSYL